MFKIINRLAWVVSMLVAFSVVNSYARYIHTEDIITMIILLLVSKRVLFGKKFIINSLGISVEKKEVKKVIEEKSLDVPQYKEEFIFSDDEEKINNSMGDNIKNQVSEIDGVVENDSRTQSINVVSEAKKEPGFVMRFFATNLLAKIGGILVFLGVLFLLQLVYTKIGPVGKLMVGFAVGFIAYVVGVWIDKKGFISESRVLFATAIVVNYLVILSGRFLLDGVFMDSVLLSDTLTFGLLILNTVFAVVTSLVYRSTFLLYFGYIVAFLNPFLIGKSQEHPYLFVGYGLIVAMGALVISFLYRNSKEINAGNVLTIAMIGGNVLFLMAPFMTTIGWLVKLMAVVVLGIFGTGLAYRSKQFGRVTMYIIISYIALFILLISKENLGITDIGIFAYLFSIVGIFVGSVWILSKAVLKFTIYILAMPLALVVFAIILGVVPMIITPVILAVAAMVYIGAFSVMGKNLSSWLQYAFFIILGIFTVAMSGIFFLKGLNSLEGVILPLSQTVAVILTSLFLLISSYYFSSKEKKLAHLYVIGTVSSILTLLPVLTLTGEFVLLSVIAVVVVVLMNLIKPFVGEISSKISIVMGLLVGGLFATGELYWYGAEYFPGVSHGVAYIILAILYCAFGYAMYLKNQVLIISEVQSGDMKESGIKIDTIYTFMGVAVSLFTLAIGIIFSQHEEIIAMVWLVESSLLYFAYKYTFSGKVFVGALILNVIGIIKLGILVDYNNTNDFMMLISLGIVFVSLLVNLKFLKLKDSVGRTVHDILHGLGMIILASLFVDIISGCNVIGGGILGISFFILILAFWYRHLRVVTTILKVFLLGSIAFIAISHIQTLSELFSLAIKEVKLVGGLLQPLTTIIIVTSLLVTKKIVSKKEEGILLASSALFLLITTTKYVYEIFSHNLFAITIYWGLLAFVIIGIGIEKNIIKCRTLGLYLLILTFGKIIFYDIWLGVDNTVTRVVALMLIGGLTIGISVLYTRKYGDNIKGELQVENLFKSKE